MGFTGRLSGGGVCEYTTLPSSSVHRYMPAKACDVTRKRPSNILGRKVFLGIVFPFSAEVAAYDSGLEESVTELYHRLTIASALSIMHRLHGKWKQIRGIAQSGSAPALGAGCREFDKNRRERF